MVSKLAEERDMMEDAHNTSRSELEAIKATSLNFQSQLTESSRKLNEVRKFVHVLYMYAFIVLMVFVQKYLSSKIFLYHCIDLVTSFYVSASAILLLVHAHVYTFLKKILFPSVLSLASCLTC